MKKLTIFGWFLGILMSMALTGFFVYFALLESYWFFCPAIGYTWAAFMCTGKVVETWKQ
jgi:hypothetical protein